MLRPHVLADLHDRRGSAMRGQCGDQSLLEVMPRRAARAGFNLIHQAQTSSLAPFNSTVIPHDSCAESACHVSRITLWLPFGMP